MTNIPDITDLSARVAEIDRRGDEFLDCGSDPEHVAIFRIEKKLDYLIELMLSPVPPEEMQAGIPELVKKETS